MNVCDGSVCHAVMLILVMDVAHNINYVSLITFPGMRSSMLEDL